MADRIECMSRAARAWNRMAGIRPRYAMATLLLAVAGVHGSVRAVHALPIGANGFVASGDSLVVSFTVPPNESANAIGFDARIESKAWSGSANVLRVRLDGRVLKGERLANKPMTFSMANGRLLAWATGDLWRVVYSPDFDPARNARGGSHAIAAVPPFTIVLLAGEFLQPGPHRLVLQHAAPKLPRVEVRNLELVSVAAVAAGKPSSTAAATPGSRASAARIAAVARPATPPARAGLATGGGVQAQWGAQVVRVTTEVSAGGTTTRLGHAERSGGWSGSSRAGATNTDAWRLDRSVRTEGSALLCRDVVRNTSRSDMGFRIEHRIERDPAGEVWLGGIRLPAEPVSMHQQAPEAPSAVQVAAGSAVGLLPASDVLWNHAQTFRDANGVGLRDASLCLAPGDSVVLAWRLIGVAGGYFDWLNAARVELNTGFTLEGGFAFGSLAMADWPVEKLREWIRVRGLRYVASPAPSASSGHGLHGSALLDAPNAQDSMRRFAAAVHRASPETRVLAYFHAYLCNRSRALERYSESRVQTLDGKPVYYPSSAHPREYALFVPVAGTAFAADLEALIAKLLEIGFDGLYWDELSGSVQPWTWGPPWDGRSGDLDSRAHRLLRRKSSIALLAQPWLDAQIERLLGAGHALVANTEPVTVTLQRHRFPRFVESGDDLQLPRAQLWSPVALGDRLREKTAADIAARIAAHVDRGLLYYFYSPVVEVEKPTAASLMYPATILRLEPGMVMAKERIVTTRSVTVGWDDASQHEVHVFDAWGREIDGSARTFEEGGNRWTTLSLPANATAVVLRR